MVRAGSAASKAAQAWGFELTVRDPLGFYHDQVSDGTVAARPRKPNRLRRWLAMWLFNPDPGIVWAKAAARDQHVLDASKGAALVLASSPPESAHVGAATLARALRARLIIDMRDGWLDDPLKPLLRGSSIRRWIEGKLEKRLLRQAQTILVTSRTWQSMLEDRLPFTCGKSVVLTNGFPPDELLHEATKRSRAPDEPLKLIHAGRFTGSRLTQKVSRLLEPLSLGLSSAKTKGRVILLGNLEAADFEEVGQLRPAFEAHGWAIEVRNAVPRDDMMAILSQSDGLLLLSASAAALPSKMFEYLPLGIPVFVATPDSSALWDVGESAAQMFLTDYRRPDAVVARRFIEACEAAQSDYEIPQQFSEKALCKTFLQAIRADTIDTHVVQS